MSILKTKYIQLGDSLVANNNFTIYQPPSEDGTLKIAFGNADGPKTDVLSIANTGTIATVSGSFAFTGNTTIGDAASDTLTITGTSVSIPNGLNIDSNTLVIDSSNNRVGFGISSPSYKIDVSGDVNITGNYKVNGANVTPTLISDTAPSSPIAGNLWWDSSVGSLRIYYTDGDTSQWVDAVDVYATNSYSTNNSEPADLYWNSTTDTYSRTVGLATDQKITSIHNKMQRCVLNDDGTVNYYLNSANSSLKIDGTAANLSGADGMVMVEIPKFYHNYTHTAGVHRWQISETPLPGFTLHPAFIVDGVVVDKRYYSAYDACVWTTGTTYQSGLNYDDNVGAGQNWNTGTAKLASVSGIFPACGINIAEARTLAANRGTGWRQLDFYLVSAVQLLYLIEYGSYNSQLKISNGNTRHTTTWPASSGTQTDSRTNIAGLSNTLGNYTGGYASGTINTANNGDYMSYRGIENFYGNLWNWVDGFNINNNQGYVVNENRRSYLTSDTTTNYTALGSAMVASNGYPTNIQALSSAFLPSAVGGSSTTYLTDYYYQNTGWRVALFGGSAFDGARAGAFFWSLDNASSYVSRNIGARLVF